MSDHNIAILETLTDTVEDQEDFVLDNRVSIMCKLRQLAKSQTMLIANFKGGSQSINTMVIKVLKDWNLVTLDLGPTPELNTQLLESNRVIFKSEVNGVTVRFKANSVIRAKLHGESVFAVPIPTEMLWVQKRQFFRVTIPLGMPAYCHIRQDNDSSFRKYPILDISAGGLCLDDEHRDFHLQTGDRLHNCRLELPEFGNGKMILEIRGLYKKQNNGRSKGHLVGCQFHNLGMSFAATLQRYINHVDTMKHRVESENDAMK